MSLVAVIAALWIALRGSHEKKRDSADLEKVFAPAVAQELRVILYHCYEVTAREKASDDIQRAQRIHDELQAIQTTTLELVASRDIYRGKRGQALMLALGELLALKNERSGWTRPENSTPKVGLRIDTAGRVSIAKLLERLCGAALKQMWSLTTRAKEPIPDAIDPYG